MPARERRNQQKKKKKKKGTEIEKKRTKRNEEEDKAMEPTCHDVVDGVILTRRQVQRHRSKLVVSLIGKGK
jgi:hypothetical protein